jgi:hypothetical protein
MRGLGAGIPVVVFVWAVAGRLFDETNAAARADPAGAADTSILGRTLTVRTDGKMPAYDVVFTSGDGRHEDRVAVPGGTAVKNLAVPHRARRFVVQVGPARSAAGPLSGNGGAVTIVRITLRERAWLGLQRAVGLHPPADYEVVLEPQVG